MSDLEQAEALLVEAREEAWDASRRLLAAAIEVGRLRALAEVEPIIEAAQELRPIRATEDYWYCPLCDRRNVSLPADPADMHSADCSFRTLRAALAAREEPSS